MAEAAQQPPLAAVAQEVEADAALLAVHAHNLLHVVRVLAGRAPLAHALGVVKTDLLLGLPAPIERDPSATRTAHSQLLCWADTLALYCQLAAL